jgi:hypothetical protein
MEFGRSKSKFQEVPETGVTFVDVAVSVAVLLVLGSACAGQCLCWGGLCWAAQQQQQMDKSAVGKSHTGVLPENKPPTWVVC